MNSKKYWNDRYLSGGHSGAGSRGELAVYKASIINQFLEDCEIVTVCELGCGDGNFELFDVTEYTGYDVSEFIIQRNREKFPEFKFADKIEELTSYELTMSLDVIFHLVEDDVYKRHMEDLFRLSERFVIIYSPNVNNSMMSPHCRYREFFGDVPDGWWLVETVSNPFKGKLTQSDFYIFEKI